MSLPVQYMHLLQDRRLQRFKAAYHHEQTSKSSIPVESASEHQESTSGSDIEEESTKQSKSDHVQQSRRHQQQGQAMQRDNAISHRMPQRRSVSIPGIPNKYNPAARPNLNTCDGGHQSERELTTQGISWSTPRLTSNPQQLSRRPNHPYL